MPSKPGGLGPYDYFCPLCWRRDERVILKSQKELEAHLKAHFMAAAPFRILAIAR